MKEYTLFVGGYTRPFFGKEGGEGIYVFGMNPETGALTLRSTNHQAENPTFLQQRGSLLYSVGELDESEISAFRISEDKTQVTLINKLPLGNHTGYGTQLTLGRTIVIFPAQIIVVEVSLFAHWEKMVRWIGYVIP